MINRALLAGAAAVFLLFLGVTVVTLVVSLVRNRRDLAREAARETVSQELFGRLAKDNPKWDEWLSSLDRLQREIVRDVLYELLRQVTGSDRESLLSLARCLNVGDRMKHQMREGSTVDRQIALTWVALIDVPIDNLEVFRAVADQPELRQPAARIFYERRESFRGPSEWGTRLLLWEGRDTLTVTGLATLYRLNRREANALLYQGRSYASSWQSNLTIQVLNVLSKCQITRYYERMRWVVGLTTHAKPDIRAAAIKTFGSVGWHKGIRDHLDIKEFVNDRSPAVRNAAYRMLGDWGDPLAANWLTIAAKQEPNERVRLEAIRNLHDLGLEESDVDTGHTEYWAWVDASSTTDAEMDPMIG